MGLFEPIVGEGELGREMWLPESNVTDAANSEHGDELAALLL